MTNREFARKIVRCFRTGIITLEIAKEIGRRIALTAAGDQFDFARYVTKLLIRHRRKPGRRRDPEKQRLIAEAAILARFNVSKDKKKKKDLDAAAANAAALYGVSEKAVFRAAFERKDEPMRKLIRKARKNSTGL